MKTNKPQTLTFTSLFCIKRLIISFFTVFFNELSIVNIFINIFANLIMAKFLIDHMPMEFKYLNYLEIINESFMLFFNYFLFLFSIWSGKIELRY